ncbi:hypothetical protein FGB62_186g027 [Gracilaria domingensis]|nr:hypothetical protein FGB62_186g027 [Gracilaria domingensis]
MYTPDRAQHIALASAFGAFYSTLASLLGLSDEAVLPDMRAMDGEMRQLLSGAQAEWGSVFEPSEMSLPTSTSYSRSSSAFSFSNRLSQTTKSHFFQRVAHPLRVKLARHAVHHSERTSWLSSIPSTRRAQNELIGSSMGFVPEYLLSMRSHSHRSVFIYLIDSILLCDSDTLSIAIKNLACYILARSSENSVLTAHAAFLANRFGALDSQLSICMDVPKLQAMQRAYALLDSTATSPASSTMTLTDHQTHQFSVRPRPEPVPTRRSRRADRFRFPEYASGVDFKSSSSPRLGATSVNHPDDGNDSDPEQLLDDDSFLQSEPSLLRRGLARLTRKDSDRRATFKRSLLRPQQPRYQEFDTRISSWECDSSSSSSKTVSTDHNPALINSVHSLFAFSDDPEVPDVSGLNSFPNNDFNDFDDDDVQVDRPEDYSVFQHNAVSARGGEGDEDIDLSTFTRKEVAFLLLAHEVVQAALNNSRLCSKYADVAPSPLISPAQAAVMHKLFEPEAIMEQISVIATFGFLQRWLECFPYKPGALEAPVRRFAQTSFAHSISLGSVGQRSNSRYAEDLREQTGRSLRLPRHAVAPRHDNIA